MYAIWRWKISIYIKILRLITRNSNMKLINVVNFQHNVVKFSLKKNSVLKFK